MDIPTKQWNYYSEWGVYYSEDFPSSTAKWPTCFKLIGTDPKYIQNISKISKIYAKKTLPRNLWPRIHIHTYTDIKMIKIQKTSRFFYAPFFILQYLESLETTMTITWNKYSKHPLVPLLDYLHHTAETCRSGGVIPYYTHSS